jgi:hypothetical protein
MKQSAVNWLEQELKKLPFVNVIDVFNQAKEMEKQQIIDAYANGSNDRLRNTINDYYDETYGSKGSETKQ